MREGCGEKIISRIKAQCRQGAWSMVKGAENGGVRDCKTVVSRITALEGLKKMIEGGRAKSACPFFAYVRG